MNKIIVIVQSVEIRLFSDKLPLPDQLLTDGFRFTQHVRLHSHVLFFPHRTLSIGISGTKSPLLQQKHRPGWIGASMLYKTKGSILWLTEIVKSKTRIHKFTEVAGGNTDPPCLWKLHNKMSASIVQNHRRLLNKKQGTTNLQKLQGVILKDNHTVN